MLEVIQKKVVSHESYLGVKEELKDAKDSSDLLKQKVFMFVISFRIYVIDKIYKTSKNIFCLITSFILYEFRLKEFVK